ncbi:MAG TPA: ATP-binding protein [Solirubrobacterales bacterium]|nr:ATP-binding protein [Solirubrobacterales bacterium]
MSGDNRSKIEALVAQAERLGVVGSPSTTAELAMDVLGTAVQKKLVGELAFLQFPQDGQDHYALGQITEVELRNVWHEDPTIRSLIRQRGGVEQISERQDTHLGRMTLSAIFAANPAGTFVPAFLGTVPSTGSNIYLVRDEVLDTLMEPFKKDLFYLGRVYGSSPLLPMWFKHFDSGKGGAGEAYHLGIFGKSGSGKSVLAKLILMGYARHKEMGAIVIDPQGEFARDFRSGPPDHEGLKLPIKEMMSAQGREVEVLGVRDLVLDRWEIFEEILFESPLLERLSMRRDERRRRACSEIVEHLEKKKVRLTALHERASFDCAWEVFQDETILKRIYKTKESRENLQEQIDAADLTDIYTNIWQPVAGLFNASRPNARRVTWAVDSVLQEKKFVVLDLSGKGSDDLYWNARIQALTIRKVLGDLKQRAETAYEEKKGLNTLVLIDEAHRLAPREKPDDSAEERVRAQLIDAVRTTRKYGLGWMFISQTLASLHQEILNQMRIMFFGFGLALGQEYDAVARLIGSRGPALDLYRLFRDPHSSFSAESREYSFMTIGPVSPLSFAGTPLFLNVFNSVDAFEAANPSLSIRNT